MAIEFGGGDTKTYRIADAKDWGGKESITSSTVRLRGA